jgi:acyl-CoA synthetase (AMP-forming)/AMP-acid ligase II
MPASAHSIVLYLSVLRAGAIAVLCNPGYTILELEHALNVVEPQVIIGPTQICDCIASIYTTMGKPFPKFAITDRCSLVKRDHISYISDFWQLSKGYSSKAEAHFARLNWKPVSWTETATMAFSSGTSGMPKAVEISHKALISLYLAARPTGCFNMTKQEKTLIPIPTFHVGGLSFWLQASIKGDHCIFTSSSPFSLVSFAEICLKWRCQVSAARR